MHHSLMNSSPSSQVLVVLLNFVFFILFSPLLLISVNFLSCLTCVVGTVERMVSPLFLCSVSQQHTHTHTHTHRDWLWQRTSLKRGLLNTVKQGRKTMHDDSDAYRVTTFSLTMEREAVIHAVCTLACHPEWQTDHSCHHSRTPCTCHKIKESVMGFPHWHAVMCRLWLQSLLWIDCCGHAKRNKIGRQTGKRSRHH